jgi:beta-glucosidase
VSTRDTTRIDERTRAVVAGLTVDQQIGLLLHPMVILGDSPDASAGFGSPSMRELIVEQNIRFFCLGGPLEPRKTARLVVELQAIARSSGSRLPLVLSTDPRHGFMQTDGAAHRASGVSQWPENLGLGAIGDADLVRAYADIVRRDYLAMGIRMALHPQIDLTTEPRWARQAQSFGSDPAATARLVRAFLDGLQGPELGPESIAATVKHFPGGGPQQDGEDPHFPYGREQVYPAGRFDDHLEPFRAAIDSGTAAIMPYYGMPVGLEVDGEAIEPVGFAFNRQMITGLLRERLGFDGLVLSDFGLVTDIEIQGKPFPARAWGVESLTEVERVAKILCAGVDQLGGELDASLVRRAVDEGLVSVETVRISATRIVRLMIALGLLDDERNQAVGDAATTLPRQADVALGRYAQARAVTVLQNGPSRDNPVLPLVGPRAVHLVNVSSAALPEGWAATAAAEADVAIVRIGAPYEARDEFFLEAGMQQGSLEFPAETIASIISLARSVPVVLVVELTRPAILTPLVEHVAAIVGEFGASDAVVLSVLTGETRADGRLPFELPRSMRAVEESRPDAANDTFDPLFAAGSGLDLATPAVAAGRGDA